MIMVMCRIETFISKSRKTCCRERIDIWVFLLSICLFCFFFLCSHWFATIIFCAKVCVLFGWCKTYLIILSLIAHIKILTESSCFRATWNGLNNDKYMHVWEEKNLLMGIWLMAHYGLILHIKWYSFPSVVSLFRFARIIPSSSNRNQSNHTRNAFSFTLIAALTGVVALFVNGKW